MQTKPKCHTIADVARYLRLSPEAVKGLILSGKLQAMNVSPPNAKQTTYRISPKALADFERATAVEVTSVKVRRRRSNAPEFV